MDLSYLRQPNVFGGMQTDPYQGVFGQGMNTPQGVIPPNPSDINMDMLRGSNVFGARPFTPDEISSGPDDIESMMNRLYTPEHTAQDRFSTLASSYPQREKPSILRRIGAMIEGLGGANPNTRAAQDNTLYGPYNRKVKDWNNQVGPAEQAANLERYGNTNERMLAYDVAGRKIQQGQLEETQRKNQAAEENRKQSLAVRDWKNRNPNHVIKQLPNGHLVAIDPESNEVTDFGKNSLDQSELIGLNQQNALARIDRSAAHAMARRVAIPGDSKAMAALPSQAIKARQLAAKQLAEDFPAYADYVEVDPANGDVKITPPHGPSTINKLTGGYLGSESSGPSQAEYDHMVATLKEYEGKYAVPFEPKVNPRGRSQKQIPPNAIQQRNKKTGQIRFSIDGGKTWEFQ